MTQPDQNPPPRTDMSAITAEEFSNQILCSHINGDAYVWNHNCQVIQSAINQSTSAMRDELERVKGELDEAESGVTHYRDQLQKTIAGLHGRDAQLAAQSARVQALEAALRGIRGLCDYRAKQDGLQLAVQCRDEADAALSQEQATTRNV